MANCHEDNTQKYFFLVAKYDWQHSVQPYATILTVHMPGPAPKKFGKK